MQTWYVSWYAQLPDLPKNGSDGVLLVKILHRVKCYRVSRLLCMWREMFHSAAGKPQQWLCNAHGLERGPKVAEGVNVCKVGIRYHITICSNKKTMYNRVRNLFCNYCRHVEYTYQKPLQGFCIFRKYHMFRPTTMTTFDCPLVQCSGASKQDEARGKKRHGEMRCMGLLI